MAIVIDLSIDVVPNRKQIQVAHWVCLVVLSSDRFVELIIGDDGSGS